MTNGAPGLVSTAPIRPWRLTECMPSRPSLQLAGESPISLRAGGAALSRFSRFATEWRDSSHIPSHHVASLLNGAPLAPAPTVAVGGVFLRKIAASVYSLTVVPL